MCQRMRRRIVLVVAATVAGLWPSRHALAPECLFDFFFGGAQSSKATRAPLEPFFLLLFSSSSFFRRSFRPHPATVAHACAAVAVSGPALLDCRSCTASIFAVTARGQCDAGADVPRLPRQLDKGVFIITFKRQHIRRGRLPALASRMPTATICVSPTTQALRRTARVMAAPPAGLVPRSILTTARRLAAGRANVSPPQRSCGL